jgi:hypothetical protein
MLSRYSPKNKPESPCPASAIDSNIIRLTTSNLFQSRFALNCPTPTLNRHPGPNPATPKAA